MLSRPFYKYDGIALSFKYGTNEHRFYDYLIKKENYQRRSKELKQGQLYLTVRIVEKDMEISKGSAQRLIDMFVELGIIVNIFKPIKGSTKPSIYCMNTYADNDENVVEISDINTGTDIGTDIGTDRGTDKLSNTNSCNVKLDTDSDTDIGTDSGTSKKELIKKNYKKEIYTEIFDYWISKGIYKHREFTKNMENAIKKTLKDYTLDQIKQAIDNYAEMYKSDYKYCNHKWTLVEFLTRTQDKTNERQLELHLNEGVSYERYLEYTNKEKPKEQLYAGDLPPRLD